SVNTRLATDDLLHRAQRLGKQVHVWTVNEPRAMRRLIEHGVDNVITDDPERFLEIRRERASLGDGQRLLLACASLLAGGGGGRRGSAFGGVAVPGGGGGAGGGP